MGEKNILLIDDTEIITTVVGNELNHLGYTPIPINSGEMGIKAYNDHHKRIMGVILDIMMPDMTGDIVLANMQKINPYVKVLIHTAYNGTKYNINQLLIPNQVELLPKPHNIETLVEKLKLFSPIQQNLPQFTLQPSSPTSPNRRNHNKNYKHQR